MSAKILIVEDEILVGLMLKKKIEASGYQVCELATTGDEAVAIAAACKPDVLFMDVSLPGDCDGVEAALRIRSMQNLPVVFFTGNHLDENLIRRSEQIRPVAILDKMGPFSAVLKAVEQALAI